MTTVSVIMTVIVLNFFYRGPVLTEVPPWAKKYVSNSIMTWLELKAWMFWACDWVWLKYFKCRLGVGIIFLRSRDNNWQMWSLIDKLLCSPVQYKGWYFVQSNFLLKILGVKRHLNLIQFKLDDSGQYRFSRETLCPDFISLGCIHPKSEWIIIWQTEPDMIFFDFCRHMKYRCQL